MHWVAGLGLLLIAGGYAEDAVISGPSALRRDRVQGQKVETPPPAAKPTNLSKTKAKDKLPIDWQKRDETKVPQDLKPAHKFRKIYDGPDAAGLPQLLQPGVAPSDVIPR